jgi:hypothetical protein
VAKHVKPITYKEAMKKAPPNEARTIVVAAINRGIRKALRNFEKEPILLTIPNHIAPELAAAIAKDYERGGWKVTVTPGDAMTNIAWRFTFEKGATS